MIDAPVSRGTRIYEKVVEKLKGEIAAGNILPGDPLPSERQLMDTFGVSRSSLREAFRVMELLGLIESIPGKGRFVRHPRTISADRSTIQLEDSAILELMEARRILDPAIAGESAMRATPSDLTRILRVITATEKTLSSPEERGATSLIACYPAAGNQFRACIDLSAQRRVPLGFSGSSSRGWRLSGRSGASARPRPRTMPPSPCMASRNCRKASTIFRMPTPRRRRAGDGLLRKASPSRS